MKTILKSDVVVIVAVFWFVSVSAITVFNLVIGAVFNGNIFEIKRGFDYRRLRKFIFLGKFGRWLGFYPRVCSTTNFPKFSE